MASNSKSNSNTKKDHQQQKQHHKHQQPNKNHNQQPNPSQSSQSSTPSLVPASSLPSKPSFTKKTSGWAAIAASKNPTSALSSAQSSTNQSSASLSNQQLKRQQSFSHQQRPPQNRKSTSPNAPSSDTKPKQSSVPSIPSIPSVPSKQHKAINDFNTNIVSDFLTKRTEELNTNLQLKQYKSNGQEWSKLSSKSNKRNERQNDVVALELSKYIKN